MNEIERCLSANARFAESYAYAGLDAKPSRRLAVVTCMDARMLRLDEALGLETGDAHLLRNAGGLVTDDALRSLVLSTQVLGTREIIVIQHTKCGLIGLRDDELRARLESESGSSPDEPARFLGFDDLETSVRAQLERVRTHPWLPGDTVARGFIYDVDTGRLEEVNAG